jgi:putative transposase
MARQPRRALPPVGVYHVTGRGVARTAIFLENDERRLFLRLLADEVERHGWRCHAFCLMSNHYHLIVATELWRLSDGMQRLNGIYAQAFNKRHRRSGHLFGERYRTWVVRNDRHLRAACRYVVYNPVRAGLCDRADDWPWSGLRQAPRAA